MQGKKRLYECKEYVPEKGKKLLVCATRSTTAWGDYSWHDRMDRVEAQQRTMRDSMRATVRMERREDKAMYREEVLEQDYMNKYGK
jgi:hypothetical protein